MRYRVTLMERTDGSGNPSEIPTDYVAINVPDGVIVDQTFVERREPDALHNQDAFEEDDSFLSIGSETWDYIVAAGREAEFLDALKNSQMVMEYVPIDDDVAVN